MDAELIEDEQELAQRVGQHMYARDTAAHYLNLKLDHISPGHARMSMTITRNMLNGHHLCHGGFIFTLADDAFAYACNSRNHSTVAAGCSIEYLAPAREGDVLTADAREHFLAGRTGVYDVDVTNQHGKRIAVFRGKSHRVQGEVLDIPAQPSEPPVRKESL